MSKELLEALSDLRSDPTIKSVLSERRAAGADGASPVHRFYDGGPTEDDDGDGGTSSAVQSAVPFPKGSPNGSHGFIQERNEARNDLGTSNWLQQHRDELMGSEKKRVENRLRAENMFAVAQLEYEQLVGDLRDTQQPTSALEEGAAPVVVTRRIGGEEEIQSPPAVSRGLKFDESNSSAEKTVLVSSNRGGDGGGIPPPPHQPLSPPRQSQPPQQLPARHDVLDHHDIIIDALPAAAKVTLPTPTAAAAAAQESEQELYVRKQKELATSVEASPAQDGGAVQQATGGEGRERGKVSPFPFPLPSSSSPIPHSSSGVPPTAARMKIMYDATSAGSPNATVAAGSPRLLFKETVAQQRFDQDFATMVEAIQQRDRTIERMERLMREDKNYYDNLLVQKTSEIDHMRSSCETRVQAMKTEMTHVLEKTRRSAELDQHDIKGKLSSMEHSYERGLADLRTEFSAFLSAYQADCDKKMREMAASAESSIRTARDAYTVDQAAALDKERKALVGRIQKEQDYMLKDAEMTLRSEIDKVLFHKVKAQVEASVRVQLRAELLPIVKRELLDSIRAQASMHSRDELNLYVKEQLDQVTVQQQALHLEKQQWQATRAAGGNTAGGSCAANVDGGGGGSDIVSATTERSRLSRGGGRAAAATPKGRAAATTSSAKSPEREQRGKVQREAQADHDARMHEGADEIRLLESKLGLQPE